MTTEILAYLFWTITSFLFQPCLLRRSSFQALVCTRVIPGRLFNKFMDSLRQVSDRKGLGTDMRICIADKFHDLDHTLRNTVLGKHLLDLWKECSKWFLIMVSFLFTLSLRNKKLLQLPFHSTVHGWACSQVPSLCWKMFGK